MFFFTLERLLCSGVTVVLRLKVSSNIANAFLAAQHL